MQKLITGVALQDCERWSLPLQVPTLQLFSVHPSQEFFLYCLFRAGCNPQKKNFNRDDFFISVGHAARGGSHDFCLLRRIATWDI